MNKKHFCCIFVILNLIKYSYGSISCTLNSDCNNGVCTSGICVCNKGYLSQDTLACSYKQKDQLTAFLLSFFLGVFGADW
jgi:hypothetical protein